MTHQHLRCERSMTQSSGWTLRCDPAVSFLPLCLVRHEMAAEGSVGSGSVVCVFLWFDYGAKAFWPVVEFPKLYISVWTKFVSVNWK